MGIDLICNHFPSDRRSKTNSSDAPSTSVYVRPPSTSNFSYQQALSHPSSASIFVDLLGSGRLIHFYQGWKNLPSPSLNPTHFPLLHRIPRLAQICSNDRNIPICLDSFRRGTNLRRIGVQRVSFLLSIERQADSFPLLWQIRASTKRGFPQKRSNNSQRK